MKTTCRVILLGFLMFALAGTAYAVAPVATTGTATNVTIATATLRGKVNPKSLVTRAWFEWGTTTNYGAATTPAAIGNGNAAINFTRSISNLTAGAIYHFRIVGSNVSGTTRGADATFMTAPLPPSVLTASPSTLSDHDLTAAAFVNPNGLPTTVWFQWGTTTSYGKVSTNQSLNGSAETVLVAVLEPLLPDTSYHYRAVGSNQGGIAYGNDFPFTTLVGTTPVGVPIINTTSASAVGNSFAMLNGSVNPNGLATSAAFTWGTTASYGNTTATMSIPAGTNAVSIQTALNSLTPGRTYHFRAVATNAAGVSLGADLTFATPLMSPPTVSFLSPTDITTNSATLRGSVNPNGLASTVTFEWGTTTNYGSTTAIQSLAAGSAPVPVQALIASLTPLTTYHYRVVATNAAGVSVGEDILVTATELLTLYAGQSWTYEFHDLPYYAFDAFYPSLAGFGIVSFGVLSNSFSPGSTMKLESFEQSTNDNSFASIIINLPEVALTYGAGGVRDLQGVIRFTMLTGSVVITNLRFYVNTGRSGNAALIYENTIAPTTRPQPALMATQYVSSVDFQSAAVQANVNANNLVTGLSVQWGTTTNYSSATGMASLNRDYLVWQQLTLTNLAPGTVYHARVVATNSGGTTYGEDLMFATPPPATVVTLPANNRQSASVDLNATVTGNGFATTAYFEWGATTNYDHSTPLQNLGSPVTPVGVSATVTGLLSPTVYHGRAVAYALGVTNRGEDVVFGTVSTPTNLVVTNCVTDDVRGAIERGGTVTFACDGVVVLSNQIEIANDVSLDARGHTVAFSGNDATRIFKVLPGVRFTLTNVTLANGRSTNGGAIYNEGNILAQDCWFLQNQAVGANGANGTNGLPGTNSDVSVQFITAGQPGQPGGDGQDVFGGAISSLGTLKLFGCSFENNMAEAGNGGTGGDGGVGGVHRSGNYFVDARSGGDGGAAGKAGLASGGSIASFGGMLLDRCTFTNSYTVGGDGGKGGRGGPRAYPDVAATSGRGMVGAVGGSAQGGGIFANGNSIISNSLFVVNASHGGSGGIGAPSRGLQLEWSVSAMGGNGGMALGAAVYAGSNCIIANCTLIGNRVDGGTGGAGGAFGNEGAFGTTSRGGNGGDAMGGCLANTVNCQAMNLTISGNSAAGGAKGGGIESANPSLLATNGNSYGGSVANAGGVFQVVNSIIAGGTSNNCYGVITDLGHNLSSDATPVWASGTSLNNTDPLLLPLANNGGPTLTMALGAGSPALDIADCAAAPATDQRGQPRPGGPGCDIGAYEGVAGVTPVFIARGNSATVVLRWLAEGGRTYRVEESANLNGWTPMSTNTAVAGGWLELSVPANPSPRFFRLIVQ